jgi:hypothetical protein
MEEIYGIDDKTYMSLLGVTSAISRLKLDIKLLEINLSKIKLNVTISYIQTKIDKKRERLFDLHRIESNIIGRING